MTERLEPHIHEGSTMPCTNQHLGNAPICNCADPNHTGMRHMP